MDTFIGLSGTPKEVQLQLEHMLTAIDVEEILDEAGTFLLNRIRTRFLREQAPDGTFWPPSKAAIERRKHGGTGTLFDTGRLFRSIQVGTEHAGQRVIGTDVPYGAIHQLGLLGFPKRVFLGFNQEDADLLQKVLQVRLNEMFG